MAGATSAWLYDVNDKSAEVGADSYKLKSGDVVVFRFVSDWSNISQETLKETLDKFGTCKQKNLTVAKQKNQNQKVKTVKHQMGKIKVTKTVKRQDGKNGENQMGKPR